jgi:hypothetical protein
LREIEIPVPAEADSAAVERLIDEAIAQCGLQVRLRGTLKKYPGCVHWHVNTQGEPETLEITFWPERQRAWFAIQSGRRAAWIEGAIERLSELLQQRFSGT